MREMARETTRRDQRVVRCAPTQRVCGRERSTHSLEERLGTAMTSGDSVLNEWEANGEEQEKRKVAPIWDDARFKAR